MVRKCRNIAKTGALMALLLLVLPGAASAATPAGLVGQTLAQVNGVVASTTATVGQVNSTVTRRVEATRQTVQDVAGPVRETPTPDAGPSLGKQVVKPVADTAAAVAPEVPASSAEATPTAPRPGVQAAPEPRRRGEAPAASKPATVAVEQFRATSLDSIRATSAERAAAPAAARPSAHDLPAGGHASGAGSGDPMFGAYGGGAAASAGFVAGAFAILLSTLLFAASALRTRLPRFDEVGRPLPLVFALERPG